MDGSDDVFVRNPGNCAQLGLSCLSCISEAAKRLATASPGMRPSSAVMIFRIMYSEPGCRIQQDRFLHSYQQFIASHPETEGAV